MEYFYNRTETHSQPVGYELSAPIEVTWCDAFLKPHPVETSGTEATLREHQMQYKSTFDR